MKSLAQKLRRIILLRFGLVTFRIQFRKTLKLSCSWFSDLVDVTMTPTANIINLWRRQDTPDNSRKTQKSFSKNVAMWLCGSMAIWLCGYVAVWLFGYMAMLLCGYVAITLRGNPNHPPKCLFRKR